jgi:hypothetical protein
MRYFNATLPRLAAYLPLNATNSWHALSGEADDPYLRGWATDGLSQFTRLEWIYSWRCCVTPPALQLFREKMLEDIKVQNEEIFHDNSSVYYI